MLVSVSGPLRDRGLDARPSLRRLAEGRRPEVRVAVSENALGRLQAPFDHVEQALADVLRPGIAEAPQGTFDEEHGKAMNR